MLLLLCLVYFSLSTLRVLNTALYTRLHDLRLCDRPQGTWASGSVRPAAGPSAGSQVLQALRAANLHKNPRFLGVMFLWLFGLYAVFLSPAPVAITDEKLQRYEHRLNILKDLDRPRQAAEEKWLQAEMDVRRAKVSHCYVDC